MYDVPTKTCVHVLLLLDDGTGKRVAWTSHNTNTPNIVFASFTLREINKERKRTKEKEWGTCGNAEECEKL